MTQTKILERIKKLMALASSSNEHEAALALQKAQELMAEHNLTEGKVLASGVTHIHLKSTQSVSKVKDWELILVQVICGQFNCEVMWQDGSSYATGKDVFGSFVIIGAKHNVEVAAYTAEVLLRKIVKARGQYLEQVKIEHAQKYDEMVARASTNIMRNVWTSKYSRDLTRKQLTEYGDGFCRGWVVGVAKVVKQFSLNEDDQKAIDSYKQEQFRPSGDTKKAQDRSGNMDGYAAGKKAGASESLHRPMGAESRTMIGG